MTYVLNKTQCPACQEKGADRHKDNLALYSDGHEHCFACGYHTRPTLGNQIQNLESNVYKKNKDFVLRSFYSHYTNLTSWPNCVLNWLKPTGISPKDLSNEGVYYNQDLESLVFPISNTLYQYRYFGSNPNYPKYITNGPKNQYKLFRQPSSQVFVLTEDYLSAYKVGRSFNAIPLLGAHFSEHLPLSLLRYNPILRIWLDFDKYNEAIKLTKRSSQWLPNCATIITELDPKYYKDMEIKEIVTATLPSSAKGLSTR